MGDLKENWQENQIAEEKSEEGSPISWLGNDYHYRLTGSQCHSWLNCESESE